MIMGVPSRVVFWLLFAVTIIPSGWFIGSSYFGLQDILQKLNSPSNSTKTYLNELAPDQNDNAVIVREIIRAHLEIDVVQNRQARSNSFIATRTWLRFMSSAFGSILIFIGAVFLFSKVDTATATHISAKGENAGFSLKSTSPGIIMVFVGAILMISPNFATQEIETIDAPLYVLLDQTDREGCSSDLIREDQKYLQELKNSIKEED